MTPAPSSSTARADVVARAVALRPATAADRELLLRVYASTRADELARLPWTDEQKRAFVCLQLAARDAHVRRHRPSASSDVVLADGAPAGRLSVDRTAEAIHIVDIALLPEFRGHGVGTQLLRALVADADAAGKPVTAYVERTGRALGLYRRFGFQVAAEHPVHLLVCRYPITAS